MAELFTYRKNKNFEKPGLEIKAHPPSILARSANMFPIKSNTLSLEKAHTGEIRLRFHGRTLLAGGASLQSNPSHAFYSLARLRLKPMNHNPNPVTTIRWMLIITGNRAQLSPVDGAGDPLLHAPEWLRQHCLRAWDWRHRKAAVGSYPRGQGGATGDLRARAGNHYDLGRFDLGKELSAIRF
uniref:Uncharacterized protein n=1 Tax=Candidatus Kentrum sp. LPFa TaxID=2126335 RepID=A0A450X305_9GAMM|nr:MAG: hypothetical protein BECKLPF1236B_GA0070989_13722 [Candidatus Kentron sp. LPFa]